MPGFLGNPRLIVMQQHQIPVANYEYPQDPPVDANPPITPVSWLNTVTGMLFICIDNTPGANIWVRSKGSEVPRALINLSTTYSLANNINVKVPFDSIEYDTGEFTDPSDPTGLIIPVGVSVVRLAAKIRWGGYSSGGYRLSDITKNGSRGYIGAAVCQSSASSSADEHNLVTAPLVVAPGDVFQLDVRQSSGGPLDMDGAPAGTWLSIEALEWE